MYVIILLNVESHRHFLDIRVLVVTNNLAKSFSNHSSFTHISIEAITLLHLSSILLYLRKALNMQYTQFLALAALNHMALAVPMGRPILADPTTDADLAVETAPYTVNHLPVSPPAAVSGMSPPIMADGDTRPICKGTTESCEGQYGPGKFRLAPLAPGEIPPQNQGLSPTGGSGFRGNTTFAEPTNSLEVDGPDATQIMIETFQSGMPAPTGTGEAELTAEPTATGGDMPATTDMANDSEPTSTGEDVPVATDGVDPAAATATDGATPAEATNGADPAATATDDATPAEATDGADPAATATDDATPAEATDGADPAATATDDATPAEATDGADPTATAIDDATPAATDGADPAATATDDATLAATDVVDPAATATDDATPAATDVVDPAATATDDATPAEATDSADPEAVTATDDASPAEATDAAVPDATTIATYAKNSTAIMTTMTNTHRTAEPTVVTAV
jgi:hypothetical protein